jgi:pSer/pThr/pTyr-binding forkhead associated (FHA) protein
VALDPGRERYEIGRHQGCDVLLYSPSASRQHAQIVLGGDGAWYVRPLPGRSLRAGGRLVEADVRLTDGMRLQLGGDELQVRAGSGAREAGRRLAGAGWLRLGLWGLVAVLLAVIAGVLLL